MNNLGQMGVYLAQRLGLSEVRLKMINNCTLQIIIPGVRQNVEAHTKHYITPNKIHDMLQERFNFDCIPVLVM